MDDHNANRFDCLRMIAALFVLYSHCYPLYRAGLNDPLAYTPLVSFGALGVAMFFVISGYLVTESLARSPSLVSFLIKRALRIYPGLILACVFSVFVIGTVFTPFGFVEYVFHAQTQAYWLTATGFNIQYNLPLVFADNPKQHTVNGSLWTIKYELLCYLAMAMLLAYRKTRPAFSLLMTLGLGAVGYLRQQTPWSSPFDVYLGLDYYHVTLGLFFSTGAVFSIYKDRLRPSLGLIIVQLLAWTVLPENARFLIFHTLMASLVLYIGQRALYLPKIPARLGDLSYGTYLFAFPIQQSLMALGIGQLGFAAFVFASVVLTLMMAFLSWHLIEKPALALKQSLPFLRSDASTPSTLPKA